MALAQCALCSAKCSAKCFLLMLGWTQVDHKCLNGFKFVIDIWNGIKFVTDV